MSNEELVRSVIEQIGGKDNIVAAMNCMTRLRITVKDGDKVNDEALKGIDGVLGIVHDLKERVEVVVGPGKSRKCADICAEMGIPTHMKLDMYAERPGMHTVEKFAGSMVLT